MKTCRTCGQEIATDQVANVSSLQSDCIQQGSEGACTFVEQLKDCIEVAADTYPGTRNAMLHSQACYFSQSGDEWSCVSRSNNVHLTAHLCANWDGACTFPTLPS
mmetsp:Transcript_36942/g.73104  ORF Transcript_36942/g.73104 Transcript_36942/m.73104 type:complete len:105 (-) Transcript_36942:78-392(-)